MCRLPKPAGSAVNPRSAEPPPSARTPAIVTHGYGESGDAWELQRADLHADLDIVSWDLPGHGARSMPTGFSCDIDVLTAELCEIARAAAAPPLLIGHSVGGYLSLRCALTCQIPLLGLVVISAGPGFRSSRQIADWNRRIDYVTSRLQMPSWAGRSIYMKDSLVIDGLHSLAVPTLVIAGTADRDLYRAGAKYLVDHMPHASLLAVKDAHHSPHKTHATEVNRAISLFVSQLRRRDGADDAAG
jgi:pimeloyl-ACP methyl ester carboxylesterase